MAPENPLSTPPSGKTGYSRPEINDFQVYEIDLSEGWDTTSQLEILKVVLHKLPVYRSGLLYSGFNADDLENRNSGDKENIIWAAQEEELFAEDIEGTQRNINNPFVYADNYRNPAIAVYEPRSLLPAEHENSYHLREQHAPLAVMKLKY